MTYLVIIRRVSSRQVIIRKQIPRACTESRADPSSNADGFVVPSIWIVQYIVEDSAGTIRQKSRQSVRDSGRAISTTRCAGKQKSASHVNEKSGHFWDMRIVVAKTYFCSICQFFVLKTLKFTEVSDI